MFDNEVDILDELDQMMQREWDYLLKHGDCVDMNTITEIETAQTKLLQLEILKCSNNY